jgi:hypothetical protein
MDWQTVIAVAIVVATLAIFALRFFRPKKSGGCDHGCGKKP